MIFYERIKIRKLFLINILISLIVLAGIGIYETMLRRNIDSNIVNLLTYSGLILWFLWKGRKAGNKISDFTDDLKKDLKWKEVALIILFHFMITIGFIFVILLIVSYVSPNAINRVLYDEEMLVPQTFNSKVYYAVTAVFLAPIVEEIAFRGIILNRMRAKWGIGKAVILSSLLFGILHYKLAIVGAFTFGICVALIYIRTQKILVSMIVHFINNLLVNIILFLPSGDTGSIEVFTLEEARAAGWFLGVPLTIASTVFLILYCRRNWPKTGTGKRALLILDMQQAFFDFAGREVYKAQELINNTSALVYRARENKIPVIYVQHSGNTGGKLERGKEGWHIHESITPFKNDVVIHKRTVDPFTRTSLKKELEFMNISELIVTGLQTEYSIDSACRQAPGLGYKVILASDAHSTFDSPHMDAAHIIKHHNKVLGECFVRLNTTEELLTEYL